MKAAELRIGNKILNDGKIETVSEISNAGHIFTEESGFVNIEHHIEPISLTAELVGKAGFVKWRNANTYEIPTPNEIIQLDNVHQLQNLIHALTGEELKIEL